MPIINGPCARRLSARLSSQTPIVKDEGHNDGTALRVSPLKRKAVHKEPHRFDWLDELLAPCTIDDLVSEGLLTQTEKADIEEGRCRLSPHETDGINVLLRKLVYVLSVPGGTHCNLGKRRNMTPGKPPAWATMPLTRGFLCGMHMTAEVTSILRANGVVHYHAWEMQLADVAKRCMADTNQWGNTALHGIYGLHAWAEMQRKTEDNGFFFQVDANSGLHFSLETDRPYYDPSYEADKDGLCVGSYPRGDEGSAPLTHALHDTLRDLHVALGIVRGECHRCAVENNDDLPLRKVLEKQYSLSRKLNHAVDNTAVSLAEGALAHMGGDLAGGNSYSLAEKLGGTGMYKNRTLRQLLLVYGAPCSRDRYWLWNDAEVLLKQRKNYRRELQDKLDFLDRCNKRLRNYVEECLAQAHCAYETTLPQSTSPNQSPRTVARIKREDAAKALF